MVEAVYHEEGRATLQGTTWQYEYSLKDHLGNTRVIFTDANNDGTPEVIQEADYYPFGMRHDRVNTATNHYLYNGKELNEDLGLDWYDYGARFYDGALGRFPSIDPLADHPYQVDKSAFAYTWNNPVNLTDPDGKCPTCPTALAGGIIGGLIGGGVELGRQLWNDGKVTNWTAVGGSAAQGAITGAAAGFTAGASLATTTVVAGGANAVGGTVNRTIQGQETTVEDVVVDGTVGAGLGAAGNAVGNAVKGAADDLSNVAKGKLGETVTEIKYAAQGYKSQGKAVVKTGKKTPTGRDQKAIYDHKMKNVFTGKELTVESKFNTSGLTKNQVAAQSNITTPGKLIVDTTTSQQLGNAAQTATVATGAGIDAQRQREEY